MKELYRLLSIMKRLRHPVNGCPWDRLQTEKDLQEYILEESYELLEAIDKGSHQNQIEELGDLMLQIVFLCQIHQEKGHFTLKDVLNRLNRKLISRHPHVFADAIAETSEEVKNNWQKVKKDEKNQFSILSDYPKNMPALLVAKRITEQAAAVGFDWENASQALGKVEEEIDELKEAMSQKDGSKIPEELGDLMFALVNVSRLLNFNPEMILTEANNKFSRRFRMLEVKAAAQGLNLNDLSLSRLEELWQQTKKDIE
jgi:tetrapyrrole methylase family protein/MazG family protein